jgi:beta-lactamase class C
MSAIIWNRAAAGPRECLLLTLIAVLVLVATPARGEIPLPEPIDFDCNFRRVLTEAGVPGGAYAIVRDGRIVHAGSHGVRVAGADDPVTPDTVFRIASVSKTFAAQLTAMLVDEGKLRWDDGITKFVPDFSLKRPGQAQQLQIHHLLGQSTGIVPNAYDNMLDANVPLDRILPQFSQLEPMCQPGRCYTYQNILFSLIDPAVERATQSTFSEQLEKRLLQPLGMHNTSVGMANFFATENRAMPHVKSRGAWRPSTVELGYYQVSAAAGVNASAVDLGEWLIAQMGHRPDIVSPSLVEEVTRKRVRTPRDLQRRNWRGLVTDAHYGLGWRIYTFGDEEIFMHSGWVKGYVADIAYSRARQTGLVVLLNAEAGVISEITTSFWRRELATQHGKEPLLAATAPASAAFQQAQAQCLIEGPAG